MKNCDVKGTQQVNKTVKPHSLTPSLTPSLSLTHSHTQFTHGLHFFTLSEKWDIHCTRFARNSPANNSILSLSMEGPSLVMMHAKLLQRFSTNAGQILFQGSKRQADRRQYITSQHRSSTEKSTEEDELRYPSHPTFPLKIDTISFYKVTTNIKKQETVRLHDIMWFFFFLLPPNQSYRDAFQTLFSLCSERHKVKQVPEISAPLTHHLITCKGHGIAMSCPIFFCLCLHKPTSSLSGLWSLVFVQWHGTPGPWVPGPWPLLAETLWDSGTFFLTQLRRASATSWRPGIFFFHPC